MEVMTIGWRRKVWVYPALECWMAEHGYSLARLAREVGVVESTLSNCMCGRFSPTKYTIDGILRVTGLPYEQAFRQ